MFNCLPKSVPMKKAGVVMTLFFLSAGVHAGPTEQAKRIHERLTGVIPSPSVLSDMVDEINDLDEKIAEIEEQKKAIEGQMKERVVRLKTLVNFIGQKVVEEQELDVLLDLISE